VALALYRKYRPRTFAEVIGQEHVTEPLSQALRSGRLHHAYLFSGPRGCGKTSSARILARSLNCEQGPTPEPCGVCISCKSLANDGGGSIDVLEIDAASHGGVDDARELREKAFFAPANSRFKIYVIDEAHMVSSAGFNALLKLVEEPPDYVKFIFATTEPDKVLGTIRSRTHHYPFRLIPPATLRPYLQQLTEAEGVKVEPAVFPLVTKAGGGSARDSLSVLDQLIAGAGPDGVSYARAVALLGVTDVALIDEMCDALAAGDGAGAYSTIDRVAEAGHDARRFASDLLERLRDLIVLQQVPDAVAKGLIDGPADQLEAMSAQATRLGPATLSRCADIVHNGLIEMRGTTAPRLLLELITARMLLPGAEDSTGSLLQRLERMERRLTLSGDTPFELRGEPEPGQPQTTPVAVSDAPVSGGGGLSAARAAAAAARRASGPTAVARPVAAGAVEPAAVSVAPGPVASTPEAGEPDWNQVADGAEPVVRAEQPVAVAEPEHFDDEPPWDDEPESDQYGPAASAEPPESSAPAGQSAPAHAAVQPEATAQPAVAQPVVAQPEAAAPPMVAAQSAAARSAAPTQPPVPTQSPVPARSPAVARRMEPAGVLPDAPEEPGEAAVAAAIPGQLDVTAIREVWPEIITAIGRQSKKISALASGATVRDFDGQTVVLTFRFPAHARMVAPEATLISNALYEALGGRWNIRCDVAGEGDATDLAVPSSGRSGRADTAAGGREPATDPAPSGRESAAGSVVSGRESAAGPAAGGREPAAGPAAGRQSVRNDPPRGAGSRPAQGEAGATQAQATQSAARATQNRRPEAEAPASAGGDDDWPEPARLGGPTAVPSVPPVEEVVDDEEWPEVRAVFSGNSAVSPEPVDSGNSESGTGSGHADRGAGNGNGRSDSGNRSGSGNGGGSGPDSGSGRPGTGNDGIGRSDTGNGGGIGSNNGNSDSGNSDSGNRSDNGNSSGGNSSGGNSSGGNSSGGNSSGGNLSSSDGGAGGSSDGHGTAREGDFGAGLAGGAGGRNAEAASVPAAGGSPSGSGVDGTGRDGSRDSAATRATTAGGAADAAVPGDNGNRNGATSLGDTTTPPGQPVVADATVGGASRTGSGSRNAGPGSGLAAARAAAAGGRAPAARQGAKTAWPDGSPAEEAPYDPEYDGPPPGAAAAGGAAAANFEGFDPGDEPLDEVIDEKTARESSEQQAMRLLRDAFGAEKIGES
jgi:DNA polymerase III subunit gamma/tau